MSRFRRSATVPEPSDAPLKPEVERPYPSDPNLRGLEFLAWLMDRSIKIPGTQATVGLDAILGLLPVGGDFLTGLIQAGIVIVALTKYRVPKAVAARMAANVLLDTALGSIPILGDFFDAAFKANTRNLQLLHEVRQQQQQEPEPQRYQHASKMGSYAIVAGLVAAIIIVLALVLIGFVTVVTWLAKRPLV